MKRALIVAVAVFTVAVAGPVGAEPTPNVTAEGSGNLVNTNLDLEGQSGGSKPSSGPPDPSDSVYELSPTCGDVTQNPDGTWNCPPKTCGDGDREYVQIEESQDGDIRDFETMCGLPDNSPQSLAIAEFYQTEVVVPAPTVHPRNGLTLVNFPNVYSTEFTGYEHNTDIQTADVRLKFTPVKYVWNFGDGDTFISTVPGEPFDKNRTDRLHEIEETYPVTHRYTDTGDFATTVTIIISGEYSVNGGEWQPIGGSIQATSPGSPLNTAEARGELILPDRN